MLHKMAWELRVKHWNVFSSRIILPWTRWKCWVNRFTRRRKRRRRRRRRGRRASKSIFIITVQASAIASLTWWCTSPACSGRDCSSSIFSIIKPSFVALLPKNKHSHRMRKRRNKKGSICVWNSVFTSHFTEASKPLCTTKPTSFRRKLA